MTSCVIFVLYSQICERACLLPHEDSDLCPTLKLFEFCKLTDAHYIVWVILNEGDM